MEQLIFSQDGVLRARLGDKKPALPLSFLKKESKTTSLRFLSYWLEKEVSFENGLTVGRFLECLEPFTDFLDEWIGKDISSYIKESKKPIAINKRKDFDWVTLFFSYTISEQNKRNVISNINDLKNIFNAEKKLINKWRIYDSYMLSAYKKNEEEHYSIDGFSMNEVQHIPLFLDKEARVIINQKDIESVDENRGLINKDSFGLMKKIIYEDYHVEYLLVDKIHTLNNVIDGFFKFFPSTISKREEDKEVLKEFIEEINEENNYLTLVNDNEENKPLLKIHGGAFNSILDDLKEKEKLWDSFVKKATANREIIKIGKIEEGVLPQKKIFGATVEEEIIEISLKK